MRVATRELRSHMETFNGILGGEELEHIESELKLLAGMLGYARDAEVVEERFLRLLDSEDSDVLDETTREHLRHDMGEEYRRAHRRVVATLNSNRYLALLDSIDQLLADPPVTGAHTQLTQEQDDKDSAAEADADAAEPEDVSGDIAAEEAAVEATTPEAAEDEDAEDAAEAAEAAAEVRRAQTPEEVEAILSEHLEQAYKRLMKRHRKAVENWDNTELSLHSREEYFHDMRKSAKKLRYAAEAVGAATQLKTKRLYNACKAMQSSLGDFQDAVTSRDKLVQMADAARRRGEDTFGYGLLYQRPRRRPPRRGTRRRTSRHPVPNTAGLAPNVLGARPAGSGRRAGYFSFSQEAGVPHSSSFRSSASAAAVRAAAMSRAAAASSRVSYGPMRSSQEPSLPWVTSPVDGSKYHFSSSGSMLSSFIGIV